MKDLTTTPDHAQTAHVIARVRLAAVLLGVALAFLTVDPAPILGPYAVLAGALVMLLYDMPALAVRRLPDGWARRVIAMALAGDMAVCTLWVLLGTNDRYSSGFVMFSVVAIEAASLYRRRGALLFLAGFILAYGACDAVRVAVFHFPLQLGSVVFRAGIIAIITLLIGAISEQSERRRTGLLLAAARDAALSQELGAEAERHASLLQAMSDLGEGLVVTDNGRFVYGNEAYLRMTGYSEAELRAMPSLIALAPPGQRGELSTEVQERRDADPAPRRFESQLVTRSGRVLDVETTFRRAVGTSSAHLIAVVRDVTERRKAQLQLEASERRAHEAARRDPLTGVANRRAWDEVMVDALRIAERDGTGLTVALLDLDRFKEYNDDWGHQRGDQLLQSFAMAWNEVLRSQDTLARYGGDEFALLLPGADEQEARAVVDRLRAVTVVQQRFSVGIACWDGREGPEDLVARADAGLYRAKRRRNQASGVASGAGMTEWGGRIEELLAGHAVDSVFQPIVALDDRSVIGAEALARPRGLPAGGSVEELFDAAKRLGHTRDLDWICRRAAVRCAGPMAKGALLFINVSIHALLDPLHDVDQMLLLMRWGGIDPEAVVLEISERDPVNEPGRLAAVLAAYRAAGFRFALDDIGEGHSTLEVLATANPEFIKIARSLTVAAADPGPQSVICALVAFCDSSGAQLIAEGLETDAQVRLLRRLGVRLGQGYVLGAPAFHRALRELVPAAT